MCIEKIFILYVLISGFFGLLRWYRWTFGVIKNERQRKKKERIEASRENLVSEIYVMSGANKDKIRSSLDSWMPLIIFLFSWLVPFTLPFYYFSHKRRNDG